MNKKIGVLLGTIFVFIFLISLVSAVSTDKLLIGNLQNIKSDGLTVKHPEKSISLFITTFSELHPLTGNPLNTTTQGVLVFIISSDKFIFVDKESSEELPTVIRLTSEIAEIKEGDFITLTYDGGKILDVYLPEVSGPTIDKKFFIANDGSTYYDGGLTNLAMASLIEPIEITVYHLENNQCNLITINEEDRTNLDFDTLEECEENILIPICFNNRTKNFTCPRGLEIDWCVCENNDWNCIDNPESQCPEIKKTDLTILWIILGVVVLIFALKKYMK